MHSLSFGSIGYGVSELSPDIINLFSSLLYNDASTSEGRIDCASEIIDNALQGRIRLDQEFNIKGYEHTIKKNNKLSLEARKKKFSYLDTSDNGDDFEEVACSGGIKLSRLETDNNIQDAFEQIILDDELAYAVSTIIELDEQLQEEEDIFILKVIEQALKGIPTATEKVVEICNKYKVVAEQINIILSSNKSFDEIFSFV